MQIGNGQTEAKQCLEGELKWMCWLLDNIYIYIFEGEPKWMCWLMDNIYIYI